MTGGNAVKSQLKIGVTALSIILNVLLIVVIMNNNEEIRPDTPYEVASLVHEAAGNADHYESIKELLHQPYKEVISGEKLKQITEIHTSGAKLYSYAVVAFKNTSGEEDVLLLKLTPVLEDDKIKIQEIKIVPEEMDYLFTQ